jgi:hypothetical protein
MRKGWYWIRLEGDSELEPALYDGNAWLVNGLANELWPAEIFNYIKIPTLCQSRKDTSIIRKK